MNCFVVCLTNERHLALFPAGTIVRDPHHLESPTRCEQDIAMLLLTFCYVGKLTGQVLKSNNLYTAHHLKCSSPIENAYNLSTSPIESAYNSSTILKKVQNTKVIFGKSTETSQSKERVGKKVTITIILSVHEEKIDFSTDQFSSDQKIESLIPQSQGCKSGNTNAVVRKRQSTLSFSIKNKKKGKLKKIQ